MAPHPLTRLRLARGRRAPPRIWTFLSILRRSHHPAEDRV